jgi:hypothetical protein
VSQMRGAWERLRARLPRQLRDQRETVALKTSSIKPLGPQAAVLSWLRRLSVQIGCETPPKETRPS